MHRREVLHPTKRSRFSTACRLLIGAILSLAVLAPCMAEEAAPPAKTPGVRITFLPPPMEGTLSLGIYDKAGKLIRTLHREAGEKAFFAGLNGFITTWDGKDDAGNPAPAGKYFARGYSVGELDVEGVAYHCNDWMTDEDSPRVRRILRHQWQPGDELLVWVEQPGGAQARLRCKLDGTLLSASTPSAPLPVEESSGDAPAKAGSPDPEHLEFSQEDDVYFLAGRQDRQPLRGLQKPIAASRGREDTIWVIDQTSDGLEVKQFAKDGEFMRRLTIPADEPAPRDIAAARDRDAIFLLEAKPNLQRLRGLALDATASPESDAAAGAFLSTWKTLFSKTIRMSDDFAAVADQLDRPQPFKAEEKISVRLQPNPLLKNASRDAVLQLALDAKGAYLRAADGLPLCRVTETPHLKWAVIGHDDDSKAITIFQSDGAVVEEFRARKLANMMAFDAGDYEWSPDAAK